MAFQSLRQWHGKMLRTSFGWKSVSNQNSSAAAFKEEVMSKIKIIDDKVTSNRVCNQILEQKSPIGIDLEGLNLPNIGLVQVKVGEGDIYLFRTGINPDLLQHGGLKEVMEDADIVKVIHAASNDSSALYKSGVKLWNIYDTSQAHRVILYQCEGVGLQSAQVGFNTLCDLYGLQSNPLKGAMVGNLWRREHELIKPQDLSEDLVFYSACDVHPLLDLYDLTRSVIDPDFEPIFQDLCEAELVRYLDRDIVEFSKKLRLKLQAADVFLFDMSPGVNKGHLHKVLAEYSGYKRVLFSHTYGTAHVILSSREEAVKFYHRLQDQGLPSEFGENVRYDIVNELSTGDANSEDLDKYLNLLAQQYFILDTKLCASIGKYTKVA